MSFNKEVDKGNSDIHKYCNFSKIILESFHKYDSFGERGIFIESGVILGGQGNKTNIFNSDSIIQIILKMKSYISSHDIIFGFVVVNEKGNNILGANTVIFPKQLFIEENKSYIFIS